MNDDEELKDGIKKSMSEPAKKPFNEMSENEKKESNKKAYRKMGQEDLRRSPSHVDTSEWDSKFDRNRG